MNRHWRDNAACRGTDPTTTTFYPPPSRNARDAKRICSSCPVRTECLQEALARHERHGIWGGTTERERRQLKHHHNTKEAAA